MDLSFLMVFLKKYFMDPAKRQIFRYASGQIFSLILRYCHMLSPRWPCIYFIKCAFHPDGDEDEEDEEEGELGRDDVPVCYSSPDQLPLPAG